jgi:hypothetical protein
MTVLLRGLLVVSVLTAGIVVGRYAHPHRDAVAGPADSPSATGRPAPRCWEAMVYLPLADNSGQPFTEDAWQEALAALVVPFGGATLGTPREGCWLDARGNVCREQVRPVVISFAPERLDEFRTAVRSVGRRLGQEAMYVRFEEPRVELIPGTGR